MDISILIDEGLEGKPPTSEWLRSIVETALSAEHTSPSAQASLVLTGQERVRELNREYLGEDHPTDVLSFPMPSPGNSTTTFVAPPDGVMHLGEVIISFPQAVIQAEEHGHPAQKEIAILTVHGVLHLLGHDHDVPEAEGRMKEREEAILGLIHDLYE